MTILRPRGACPSVIAPMETGDGLLARLVPPDGFFLPDSFLALCASARRHGNGLLEVTARGSLQVRGLTPASAPAFAAEVGGGGGLSVLANPLAGLDPDEDLDAGPLARALKDAADARFPPGRLAAKVSVIVDGGGALHLDALAADLRLKARRRPAIPDGPKDRGYLLFINDLCLGAVMSSQARDAALRLLDVLAERGPPTRARDVLAKEGAAPFAAAVADLVRPAEAPAKRPEPEPLARHRLKDGTWALGIGLAFGQAEAESLMALAAGARTLHPAPGRALLLAGLPEDALEAMAAKAARQGFIVLPKDPRRRIAACAGAPACASGQIAARSLALQVAVEAEEFLDDSLVLHLSGCAKGCAHPAPAGLTVVGRDGRCDLVLQGSTRGAVVASLPPEALAAGLRRLASRRRSGESMAAALARLGGEGVAEAVLGSEEHV